MSRPAWLLAFAASLAAHLSLVTSLRLSEGESISKNDGKPVSIAGSLSGILGGSAPAVDVSAESVKQVQPVEVAHSQSQSQSHQAAQPLEPVKVNPTQPAEYLIPLKPVKSRPDKPKKSRKIAALRSPRVQAPRIPQKRVHSAGKQALRAFAKQIARALARSRPGRIAHKGTVTVAFTLSPAGRLETIRIRKSSGNANIDRAALRAVRRARFPKPPRGATRNQRSFIIPYHFRGR